MLSPNDVILLLEKWTRRFFAVDIRSTDIKDDFKTDITTTDKVHHISEMDVTTDACLDSMTVQAQTPAANTVTVIPGRVQWFEQLIEITEAMESPALPPFTTQDCDPLITDPIRWSLLCIKQDTQGNNVLFWEHGSPGMGYPEVPYLAVPLALVKTTIGLVQIEQSDILNWRSIRPGYAPGAKFQYPPVNEPGDLYDYVDPIEGAQCFVLSAGNYYYYKDGDWHTSGMPSFDNTAWYTDIHAATTRIDLPWPLKSRVEVLVFRDGQLMLLDRDYRVLVGPASFLQFNHLLVPGQRIVVLRNPFMAEAFSGSGSQTVGVEAIDIYVDGEIGNDAWEGTLANPFKTLQRGFDIIPLYSMRVYTIHAKNLKLADRLTVPGTSNQVFGYARGKRLIALILDIDDSYEWDTGMTTVASLYECNYVTFNSDPIKYRLDLIECMAAFTSTELQNSINIWGGYTNMVDVIDTGAADNRLLFHASAVGNIFSSTFHNIEVSHVSFVDMTNCKVYNLRGEDYGAVYMLNGAIYTSVTMNNSALRMAGTLIRAEGLFYHSYVYAASCKNMGDSFTPVPTFFNGTQGTCFDLVDTQVAFIYGEGIRVSHSSSLHMSGGSVDRASLNGILVAYSSSADLNNARIAYNGKSGVRGDYGSFISFTGCTGSSNSRWGCECYNISRAGFTSLTVQGTLGVYYEQIPGADTVVSKLGVDMAPGALDDKIVVGKGLKTSVRSSLVAGDYKFHIEIDPSTIAGPGSGYVINTNARQNVLIRYSPVDTTDPDTDMTVRWTGQGYMSSVCRRIYDPTVRTKLVQTNLAMRPEFVELDESIGTDFLSGMVTLHKDPILGYPVNSPYYFHTNPDGMGVITTYGTQEVTGFEINASTPSNTSIRVAFSLSGAMAWRTWNPSMMTWDLLPGSSTLQQMQSAPLYNVIAGWNPACWDLLRLLGGPAISVCFLLVSTDMNVTPEVYSFKWSYVEDGFLEDITHAFRRRYFNNRAIFTYDGSLGAQIDPPIVFSVMPTADRDS